MGKVVMAPIQMINQDNILVNFCLLMALVQTVTWEVQVDDSNVIVVKVSDIDAVVKAVIEEGPSAGLKMSGYNDGQKIALN
jgi:hypothetical protein